jgi:hypothetical protein
MTEVNIGNIKVSGNGIISRSGLLLVGGALISFGAYDLRMAHDILTSSVEILLGGFILVVREYCKTIPDGSENISEGIIGCENDCAPKKRVW